MHLEHLIYLSRGRVEAHIPSRQRRVVRSTTAQVGPACAQLTLESVLAGEESDGLLRRFRRVRKHTERGASHFFAPGIRVGEWVYFDLDMVWGTSYRDSDMPDLDDVVFFCGARPPGPDDNTTVELMLCGQTEHLLKRTATAGRMGSGTDWLYYLVRAIDAGDVVGPDGARKLADASSSRINRPEIVAQWVYAVMVRHHPPQQRARVQGLARVELIVDDEDASSSRLVLATPLFVRDHSRKPLRWITRWRLHRDLCRRYGRYSWRAQLPPRDHDRYSTPAAEPAG